jgi:hypothetical protein
MTLGNSHDATQHASEHQLMQRIQGIPVHQPQQANWIKDGGLADR